MAGKADFSTEEWNQLLQGVMLAGIAVTAAEPSGLFGSFKEAFASAGALAKAKADPGANDLVKSVVASFGSMEETSGAREGLRALLTGVRQPAEIKTKAIAALGELAALLDRKAPADAQGFKQWLRSVAQSVAEASTEGGFLGFGGVRVSEAEKATIGDIARALNISS